MGSCELDRTVGSLFVCLSPPEQFISYLAAATIFGDTAENLDLCLAFMAFSSEGSFFVPTPTATRGLGLYGLIQRTGVTKYFEPG
jgi:hypothetical protein